LSNQGCARRLSAPDACGATDAFCMGASLNVHIGEMQGDVRKAAISASGDYPSGLWRRISSDGKRASAYVAGRGVTGSRRAARGREAADGGL
jgi:hypothetical protein